MKKKLVLSVAVLGTLGSVFFIGISQFVRYSISFDPSKPEQQEVDQVVPPLFYFEIGDFKEEERPVPLPPSLKYTVELSTEHSEKKAQNKVKELSLKGIDCFYTPLNQNGQVIYKVRSGIYKKREIAQKQHRFLLREFSIKGQISKL